MEHGHLIGYLEWAQGQFPWVLPLIPALPVLGFVIGILFGGPLLRKRTSHLTVGCMALSCALAYGLVFFPVLLNFLANLGHGHPPTFSSEHEWTIFFAGGSPVKVGVLVDHFGAAMLAMVTLVVLLIEIYSIGYMAADEGYSRFHSYVSLFAAGMLGLCVSNNYLTLLVSWEIMGLCSYLLIGFWYHKDSARKAAKKAFMVTRLGDCFMLIGIFVAYAYTGSFAFDDIFEWAKAAAALPVIVVMLGIFMGAVGKSAQFPLHVWLPDAMEGPTPVSALIHAATMVSAGVYLVARSFPLLYGSHGHLEAEIVVNWLAGFGIQNVPAAWRVYTIQPMLIVAWIGGFTALMAATIAVFASDIKKVLAYSTISQLGYMMLALGVGGYTAGCFHLLTHAFFKALLFLGSGSVIHAVEHAMHHEHVHADPQDLRNMGGLWSRMPTTAITFILGTLALAGIAPFAGFFSKDEIVLEAARGHHSHSVLAAMALVAAFLTAFYMTRLCMMAFFNRPKFPRVWSHTEDSPKTMTGPLVVLAVFAVLLGLPAAPVFFGGHNYVHDFINLEALAPFGVAALEPISPDWRIAVVSLSFALTGIALGVMLYGTPQGRAARIWCWRRPLLAALMTAPKKLYWWNEVLYALFVVPMFFFMRLCNAVDRYLIDMTVNLVGWATLVLSQLWQWIDQHVVDGIVNGVGVASKGLGEIGKYFQTGKVQGYALLATVGLLALFALRLVLFAGG